MALSQVDTGSYMTTVTDSSTKSVYRVITNIGDNGITSLSITKIKGDSDNVSYTEANQKNFHSKIVATLKNTTYGIGVGL